MLFLGSGRYTGTAINALQTITRLGKLFEFFFSFLCFVSHHKVKDWHKESVYQLRNIFLLSKRSAMNRSTQHTYTQQEKIVK